MRFGMMPNRTELSCLTHVFPFNIRRILIPYSDIKDDGRHSPIGTYHGSQFPGETTQYANFQNNIDIIETMIEYLVISQLSNIFYGFET